MEDGTHLQDVARACLDAAEHDRMTFPEIVGTLAQEGFEGYAVDFRRSAVTYYPPGGRCIELPLGAISAEIAPAFDRAGISSAIRDAQQQVPGHTYKGFCSRATASGCAGYMVSIPGRRVLYYGRTAETHVEHFPD